MYYGSYENGIKESLYFFTDVVSYILSVSNYLLFWGFLGGLVVKNPSANAGVAGDVCSVAGLGRSLRGGNDNPLSYSCLGNPMERGAWQAIVHGGRKESDMTELLSMLTCTCYSTKLSTLVALY